uniref:Uncharacterized protein n=1 Tax=Ditylenchus dipsaci TaxID=166011 RepID=A0A915E4P7_9BILA
MIVVSVVSFGVAAILQLPSAQAICCAAFLLSSLHTTANGVVMILMVKPYRNFVIICFKKLLSPFKKKAVSTNNSHCLTSACSDLSRNIPIV